jgi:undecaprenyl diphosphate synthase
LTFAPKCFNFYLYIVIAFSFEGRLHLLGTGVQQTSADRDAQERLKSAGEIPGHIAIIMDGNGRWAKERGMPRISGHSEGVESVRDIVRACAQLGVKYLTLYTFSTENWKRPKDEVSLLMRLLLRALEDETDQLQTNNVRIKTIGDLSVLPREVQNELLESIKKTEDNTGLTLILALSYSGRWDLTQAIRRIVRDVSAGQLGEQDVTDDLVGKYLSTAGIPDPDLLIRTSGEFRLSNFLLWQLAYTEIYISALFWPGFRRDELYVAIANYQQRERRFGMVSEQVRKDQTRESYLQHLIRSVTGP